MRNLRKLFAVIVAVALVLTSMGSAFAATATYDFEAEAEVIRDLGLWTGNDAGDLMLGKELIRAEGAVLVLKATGKTEDDAANADKSVLSKFKDVSKIPGWATGWMALAVEEGVVNGTTAGNVEAEKALLGKDLASMFMNALGYADENNYGKAVELLAEKSASDFVDALIADLTNAKLNRDAAAAMVFDALTATAADAEETLVETLVAGNADLRAIAEEAGLIASAPAVALEVKSASAVTNAKIKVTVKEAISEASLKAAKISFADASGKAVEIKGATLAADGKSFIVATDVMTAGALYKLTIGDVTKSVVGLPADTTKPNVSASSVVKSNTSYEVKFSEKVDDTTATNIANYSINNGLTVLKAELGSDGVTVTLTTSAQTVATIYTLTVQNVADYSGNVMDKATLVFGGMAPDKTPPKVDGASRVVSNTSYEVKFDEPVSAETATNIANYTFDNGLTALKAELNDDKNIVTVTTSTQSVGVIYKLTVQNVADLSGNVMDKKELVFGGMAPDKEAPKVEATSVVKTNTLFEVVFNEKVSAETAENIANYTVDNGLSILKVELSDKTVKLTTSAQTAGVIYKLTIQNVADLAGNVMDKKEIVFGGMGVDKTPPTVSSITVNAGEVVITFSEELSDELATELGNYAFDGGLGYPLSAELSKNAKVVTLKTLAQTPAKVYNVTINNVTDLSGNSIAKDTKKSFLGQGSVSSTVVKVQAMSIVNYNTVDVIFDSEISDADLAAMTITIDKENGSAYTVPAGLAYKAIRQADKKVVRVQFKTTASVSPELFLNGKYYEATIGNVTNLSTETTDKVKTFAGTPVANEVPYAVVVTPINTTAVKVTFSEPVKGFTGGVNGFAINNSIAIASSSVSDPDKAVTEVMLYLSTELGEGKVYELTGGVGIKDAAGFVDLKTANSDSSPYKVVFGGTNTKNAAPKVQAVVAIDKYNFDIIFTEEVTGAKDLSRYTVTYTNKSNQAATLNILNGSISQDGAKVSVKLKVGSELESGIAYTLTVTGATAIFDLQGLVYDATADANKVVFGGNDSANAVPEIVGVAAKANTTSAAIVITFSEDVTVTGNFSDVFEISGAGYVAGADTYTASGNKVTINLANVLNSSSIGSIKVKDASKVKDIHGQEAKTDAISFGAK